MLQHTKVRFLFVICEKTQLPLAIALNSEMHECNKFSYLVICFFMQKVIKPELRRITKSHLGNKSIPLLPLQLPLARGISVL